MSFQVNWGTECLLACVTPEFLRQHLVSLAQPMYLLHVPCVRGQVLEGHVAKVADQIRKSRLTVLLRVKVKPALGWEDLLTDLA